MVNGEFKSDRRLYMECKELPPLMLFFVFTELIPAQVINKLAHQTGLCWKERH